MAKEGGPSGARPFSFREIKHCGRQRSGKMGGEQLYSKAWYAVKCRFLRIFMHTPRLFLLWVAFSFVYWEAAPLLPQPQTSRHLELRLEGDPVGEQDVPETMVITLVN